MKLANETFPGAEAGWTASATLISSLEGIAVAAPDRVFLASPGLGIPVASIHSISRSVPTHRVISHGTGPGGPASSSGTGSPATGR